MLTNYAFGWRRLAPLFSIRAFRHVCRPVEINPWLDGTGRGTFPNAVRQVQRAVDFAKSPEVAHVDGGFIRSGCLEPSNGQQRKIIEGDSRRLSQIPDASVDLILTDPPYFDNMAYSELSDFYLPWLATIGLADSSKRFTTELPDNLAAQSRGEHDSVAFRRGLAECFSEMRRVLHSRGRLIYSFQHRTPSAWSALAYAISSTGWRPIQVSPMLGNSTAGLHQHEGTITWDAVIVCRKGTIHYNEKLRISEPEVHAAHEHTRAWVRKLATLTETPFRDSDRCNLLRASLVTATLGMFELHGRGGTKPLAVALEQVS